MEAEDESTTYLKYLNDTASSNNYLLSSSNVELTDGFPFSEICTTDWQSENFPILLNTSMIAEHNNHHVEAGNNVHLFNQEGIETEVDEEIVIDDANEHLNDIQNGTEVLLYESEANSITIDAVDSNKMYINLSPIVKENANGNKEIYLTENDINNDSTVIQLLNTDGSVISIDKSVLSSLNLTNVEADATMTSNIEEFYTSVVAHKCKMCNFLCETDDSIKLHLNEKHPELFTKNKITPKTNGQTSLIKPNREGNKKYTIYLCSLCKLAFCEKNDLKEHMMNKHNLIASEKENKINEEETIKTDLTPKISLRSLSSSLIKQKEKARKKIKCTIKGCHVRFPSDELRQKHEQCHIGEKRSEFKCLQCEERFSIWRICSNHMWKIHKLDIGMLSCCMCNAFKSYNAVNLIKHMATHDEEKPFLCNDCGKGFKTLSQVKNHEVLHKKESSNAPNWIKTKQCEICQRHFANSKSYKKHMQSVHEKFKPFICNICGHKSARKAMLELHLRQHTGDKPHKCTYCEYRTGDHNTLRKHLMRHMGTKNYKCPYCSYTAIQSWPYKNHIKNRHPGKTAAFHCTYCPFISINADNYYTHVRRHEISMKENVGRDVDVEVPKNIPHNKVDVEDDDTQNCIFNTDITLEETVDTGGITIPAGVEL